MRNIKAPIPMSVISSLSGCVGGCLLGFILSIVLFFVLLVLDQKFSKPSDPDFANPIGVIVFVFLAMMASGVLGAIISPFPHCIFQTGQSAQTKVSRSTFPTAAQQGAAPDRLQLRSFRSQAPFTLFASDSG